MLTGTEHITKGLDMGVEMKHAFKVKFVCPICGIVDEAAIDASIGVLGLENHWIAKCSIGHEIETFLEPIVDESSA